MAEQLGPRLSTGVRHTQAASATEIERIDFNLAENQAVAILACEGIQNITFPAADQFRAIGLSLDPDFAGGGTLTLDVIDSDTIYYKSSVQDLNTSGYATNYGSLGKESWNDMPFITTQTLTAFFNTNNVGGQNMLKIEYQLLRVTDAELVRLISQRR